MSYTCPFVFALALLGWTAPAGQAQSTLFFEDFESGFAGWTMTGLWNAQDATESCTQFALPFPSGTHCAWYGSPSTCNFLPGAYTEQYLTSTTLIAVPVDAPSVALTFSTRSSAEDHPDWDLRDAQVSIDGGPYSSLGLVYDTHWRTARYDLSFAIGHTVQLRFRFWAVDWWVNDGFGWLIDDVRIAVGAQPGTPFCLGDGTGPNCPCANFGAGGRGCATSFQPAGALLETAGVASVSADTLAFTASGISNASATLFQGELSESFPGIPNGDGVLCVGGTLVRIQSTLAQGGTASYPGVVSPVPISVRGGVPASGGTRYYQVRYRNAASFCTPATYNFTSGAIVTWHP
jgi:hypothetical protein